MRFLRYMTEPRMHLLDAIFMTAVGGITAYANWFAGLVAVIVCVVLSAFTEMIADHKGLPEELWRHKARRTFYTILARGHLQVSGPLDMEPVTIYRAVSDGKVWVRPSSEFEDGRFEKVEAE